LLHSPVYEHNSLVYVNFDQSTCRICYIHFCNSTIQHSYNYRPIQYIHREYVTYVRSLPTTSISTVLIQYNTIQYPFIVPIC
jgi:hypothetical protein